MVKTFGFIGLVILVAIPLPGTGAWTGSAAATLFNFRKREAFFAILLGVLIAAALVTLASLVVIHWWNHSGAV